jgi:hypothetical protein
MVLMLIAAIAAYATIIFFISDPVWRLRFGLLALGPILWPAIWMARQFDATELLGKENPKRRYSKLRGFVQQLLTEISRLNWTVLDAHRGLIKNQEADKEIAAIKNRMSELLEEVKEVAGQPKSETEEQRMPRNPKWTTEAPASRLQ